MAGAHIVDDDVGTGFPGNTHKITADPAIEQPSLQFLTGEPSHESVCPATKSQGFEDSRYIDPFTTCVAFFAFDPEWGSGLGYLSFTLHYNPINEMNVEQKP